MIRIAAEHDWHPVFIVNQMASSIATVLKPAGLENAGGVITAAFLKDASDPAWKDQLAAKDWLAFHDNMARPDSTDPVLDHIVQNPWKILFDPPSPGSVRSIDIEGADGAHTLVTFHGRESPED